MELAKIETMLNECYNVSQIAEALRRDPSSIQKEIKKFPTIIKTNKHCKFCKKYDECKKTGICGNTDLNGFFSHCKECKIAVENCDEYEPVVKCEKLRGRKKVCKGCPNYKQCRKVKIVYITKEAYNQHEKNKLNSIKK